MYVHIYIGVYVNDNALQHTQRGRPGSLKIYRNGPAVSHASISMVMVIDGDAQRRHPDRVQFCILSVMRALFSSGDAHLGD